MVEPLRGEHLIPVVRHAASGPPVAAAAQETHRLGVGRREERLGRRRAPVDEQAPAGGIRESEAADVDGRRAVGGHHASQARVDGEAAQRPQAGGEPVDLEVALERCLTVAAGLPAQRVDAVLDPGDGLAQSLGEGGEVLLVVADEGGIGLGGEAFGQAERAGLDGVHGICSWRISRRGVQRGRVGEASRSTSMRPQGALAARPPPAVILEVRAGSDSVRTGGLAQSPRLQPQRPFGDVRDEVLVGLRRGLAAVVDGRALAVHGHQDARAREVRIDVGELARGDALLDDADDAGLVERLLLDERLVQCRAETRQVACVQPESREVPGFVALVPGDEVRQPLQSRCRRGGRAARARPTPRA